MTGLPTGEQGMLRVLRMLLLAMLATEVPGRTLEYAIPLAACQ
jgi:hypothetical protein